MSQLRDGSEILGIPIIRNAGLENPFFLGGCGFTSGLDSDCGGSGLVSLIVGDDPCVGEGAFGVDDDRERKKFLAQKEFATIFKAFSLYTNLFSSTMRSS